LGREERLTGDAVMMIQALTGVAAGGNPKPRREAATTQARGSEGGGGKAGNARGELETSFFFICVSVSLLIQAFLLRFHGCTLGLYIYII
jgi:hypothetical protein